MEMQEVWEKERAWGERRRNRRWIWPEYIIYLKEVVYTKPRILCNKHMTIIQNKRKVTQKTQTFKFDDSQYSKLVLVFKN